MSALENVAELPDRSERWQANRLSARLAEVEAQLTQQAQQIETLTAQRDEAQAELRELRRNGSLARLAQLERNFGGALKTAKDAIAERDDARHAWEKLRVENADLRREVESLTKQLAQRPPAASTGSSTPPPAPKRKPPEALLNVPPVEPGLEEVALLAQRAELVAEMGRCEAEAKAGGKYRGAGARARVGEIQKRLTEEFKPRLAAFKQSRHAEFTARQAEAMKAEAAKAIEALT